jgi:hypothetical protein
MSYKFKIEIGIESIYESTYEILQKAKALESSKVKRGKLPSRKLVSEPLDLIYSSFEEAIINSDNPELQRTGKTFLNSLGELRQYTKEAVTHGKLVPEGTTTKVLSNLTRLRNITAKSHMTVLIDPDDWARGVQTAVYMWNEEFIDIPEE